MATISTFDAASEMGAGNSATRSADTEPRLLNRLTTLNYAVSAYEESIYKSRTVTAFAFFITAAIAVAAEGSSPMFMLGFLGIALISAATAAPIARLRFYSEIQRTARAEGLSPNNSERIAASMLASFRASDERSNSSSY